MKTNPSRWMSLVTGGCGYVGRHLCLRLLALGHHVFVVDDLSTGLHPDIWLKDAIRERRTGGGKVIYQVGPAAAADAPTLTFINTDLIVALREQQQLARAPASPLMWPAFEAAFHLATTEAEPRALQHKPCTAGLKLALDACFFAWAVAAKERVGRLIYVGVGGQHNTAQASSLTRRLEQTLSVGGQQLARAAAAHEGMRVACVLPSSLYGKDQHTAHVVPALAQQMLRQSPALQLPPHLDQAYELLHIDDCVAALLHAAEHLQDGAPVHVGSGKLVHASELARMMAGMQQRDVQVHSTHSTKPAAPTVAVAVADGARMQEALGMVPQVSLQIGLAQALRAAQRRAERGDASRPNPPADNTMAAAVSPPESRPGAQPTL